MTVESLGGSRSDERSDAASVRSDSVVVEPTTSGKPPSVTGAAAWKVCCEIMDSPLAEGWLVAPLISSGEKMFDDEGVFSYMGGGVLVDVRDDIVPPLLGLVGVSAMVLSMMMN